MGLMAAKPPGFDYVSLVGGRYRVQLVVTCQRQTRVLWAISYAAPGS